MGINTGEALEQDRLAASISISASSPCPTRCSTRRACTPAWPTACGAASRVIIGAPFASGILVTGSGGGAKYGYAAASPEVQAKVRGIEAVCKAHGVALPAAALQFPLAHPAVVVDHPRRGASPSEVTQNVASLGAPIPAGFWSDLKAQGPDRRGRARSGRSLIAAWPTQARPATPLISARGISKSFAGVEVLRDVDLDLHARRDPCAARRERRRQVDLRQDPGRRAPPDARHALAQRRRRSTIASPIVAQKLGITLIHQEPISFPDLSVAENLVLGRTGGGRLRRVPWAAMTRDANRLMDLLGVQHRRDPADARPVHRRPADGRDRPRAGLRQPPDHHGRADRAADPEGGGDAVRHRPPPARRGPHHRLHHPPARGGARALRPRHHLPRRQQGRAPTASAI